MTWVSRPQWGASAQSPAQGTMPAHPQGVAIHWIGGGRWQNRDPAQVMRDIRGWHTGRGHADIDYSLAVSADGRILEGRSTRSRPRVRPASNGSRQTNESHYSIVLLTGELDPAPPAAMIQAAGAAVAWLRTAGGAGRQVVGHRDLHPTTCPGNTIQTMLPQIAAAADGSQIGDDTMTPAQEAKLDKALWALEQIRGTDLPPISSSTGPRLLAPVDETRWIVGESLAPALAALHQRLEAIEASLGLPAQPFAVPEPPEG